MIPHPQQDDIVLKCWTPSFQALRCGDKTFELRKNDRPYAVGKIIRLEEWNPGTEYTGEVDRYKITWILWEGFGLPEGYIIMSVVPCKTPAPAASKYDKQKIETLVQTLIFKELLNIPELWKEHDATIRNQTLEQERKKYISIIERLTTALYKYEQDVMDFDFPPPSEHRDMMRIAEQVLESLRIPSTSNNQEQP